MKQVKCKSGIRGFQERLQKLYSSYGEFCAYSHLYGIAKRLGYKSHINCWNKNPMVEGSVLPSDFRKVRIKH